MINLPKSTEINKPLPKNALYLKQILTNAQKVHFDEDIGRMFIAHEISERTTTIEKGKKIESFYVLKVVLKKKKYDLKNITLLSKMIPQNLVYQLEYEDETQLAIFHSKLITTEWAKEPNLSLDGLNLDTVWENIVKSIHHNQEIGYNYNWDDNLTLGENIVAYDARAKTHKQIEQLEKQARVEKQPRKKMDLVAEIRRLKGGM